MSQTISFELLVYGEFDFAVVARNTQTGDRYTQQLLSRKTGNWIDVTLQQIRENDIPIECVFPMSEMQSKPPESSPNEEL